MAREPRIKAVVETEQLRRRFKSLGNDAKSEFKEALWEASKALKERAQANHRFKNRTGNLERSIKYETKQDRGGWGGTGYIYIDKIKAPYGKFVHEGTRPHKIQARNANNLHFYWENMKTTFHSPVVFHPGIGGSTFGYKQSNKMPDDFIYRANRMMRSEINNIFRKRLAIAKERAMRGGK